MQNTINISNALCKALKSRIEKTPEGLLGIQLGILALYKLQADLNPEEAIKQDVAIDLDDIATLGVGLQYTASGLNRHLNDGRMARNWIINTAAGHARLINYANYRESSHEVIISFNSEYKDLLIPTRDKSIFTLDQLFRFGDTVSLLLYIYIVSVLNTEEHIDEGRIMHTIDYSDLRQILGYAPITSGRTEWHNFNKHHLKKAKGNISKLFPGTRIIYAANSSGPNHRITSLTLEISGLETEGIWGDAELEEVNGCLPEFTFDGKEMLKIVDSCISQDRDDSFFPTQDDSVRRAEVNTAYIRVSSLVATGRWRCINRLEPAGYRTVPIGNSKYLFNRLHLVARRLGGPDVISNVLTGTSNLNAQMTLIEAQVAKYVQENDGHVLYRVTPHYYGQEILCRKVQIEAFSLDDFGGTICINTMLLNGQRGYRINYLTGEVTKIF